MSCCNGKWKNLFAASPATSHPTALVTGEISMSAQRLHGLQHDSFGEWGKIMTTKKKRWVNNCDSPLLFALSTIPKHGVSNSSGFQRTLPTGHNTSKPGGDMEQFRSGSKNMQSLQVRGVITELLRKLNCKRSNALAQFVEEISKYLSTNKLLNNKCDNACQSPTEKGGETGKSDEPAPAPGPGATFTDGIPEETDGNGDGD
ncbi:hypothetical protein GH733_011499 [Mirounga leonina]|nr:hypothetical protein GH733_011499 [Mirounga leonina]